MAWSTEGQHQKFDNVTQPCSAAPLCSSSLRASVASDAPAVCEDSEVQGGAFACYSCAFGPKTWYFSTVTRKWGRPTVRLRQRAVVYRGAQEKEEGEHKGEEEEDEGERGELDEDDEEHEEGDDRNDEYKQEEVEADEEEGQGRPGRRPHRATSLRHRERGGRGRTCGGASRTNSSPAPPLPYFPLYHPLCYSALPAPSLLLLTPPMVVVGSETFPWLHQDRLFVAVVCLGGNLAINMPVRVLV